MKRAVLVTGHFARQKRRGSLLWVAEHLQAAGWHVTVATVGYSWLSRLRHDPRLGVLDTPPRPGLHRLGPTLDSLFGWSPIHPFSTRRPALDRMMRPVHRLFPAFWRRRLRAPLAAADLVIVESGAPLMLAPLVHRLAPHVPRIYRINDDIDLLNLPAFLTTLETAHARHFTRISSASPLLLDRVAHPNKTLDPMGIPRTQLAHVPADPYGPRAAFEAVCAGTTQLDMHALVRIADSRPNWRLHVLGRLREPPPDRPNLLFHGEKDFETTLAHVQHADIGLAPYKDRPGVEYQSTNSNRILLYRHAGLPVLGPDRLCHPDLPGIVGYGETDALGRCETMPRRPESLPDWADLAASLAQNPETEPPTDVLTVPASVRWSRV